MMWCARFLPNEDLRGLDVLSDFFLTPMTMLTVQGFSLIDLLTLRLGRRRAERLGGLLDLPEVPLSPGGGVSRAQLSAALAALLFEDVTARVPEAAAYAEELQREGRRLTLDHGALRTVAAPSGGLPMGAAAFTRLLEPLGYSAAGVYPLERLGMTGYAFAHRDFPEALPQYFISELHPKRFSEPFQAAVARVLLTSEDPLPLEARASLRRLQVSGELPIAAGAELLVELAACFGRQHAVPRVDDYELLLAESPEMAWIATEGQAFNHATDRVADVAAVAERQRGYGRAIKDVLECSSSGRVIQTALRAATVERLFEAADGSFVTRRVPGSFHEFIQRGRHESGSLDLAFDSGNAEGIFSMTREVGA